MVTAENEAKTNNKTVVMVEREILQEEMRILFGHLSELLTGYTLGRVNNCYLRKVAGLEALFVSQATDDG